MDIKTKTERQTKEMVKETVFKERAQKVLTSMKENGMDQLIVSDPASINYLMGRLMNPGERLMVLVFDAAAGKTELVISKPVSYTHLDVYKRQRVSPRTTARPGDTLTLGLDLSRIHIFDKDSELVVLN